MNHSFAMLLQKIKPLLIAVAVLFLLFLLLSVGVPMMVSTDRIESQLHEKMSALAGRDAVIGKASVSVFPSGQITIDGMALHNSDNSDKRYFLSVDKVMVGFSVIAALTGSEPELTDVTLSGVDIELERFKDGSANWELLRNISNEAASSSTQTHSLNVNFQDANVHFTHHGYDYELSFPAINGGFSVSQARLIGQAHMQWADQPLTLKENCLFSAFKSMAVFDGDCITDITHGENKLTLSGRVINSAQGLSHRSQLKVNAADVRRWLDLWLGRGEPLATERFTQSLPLNVVADIYEDSKKAVYNISQMSFAESSGKGALSFDYTQKPVVVQNTLYFDRLNLDALSQNTSSASQESLFAGREILPADISASLAVSAKQIDVGGVVLSDAVIKGQLDQAELLISNASAKSPKEGRVVTLGTLSNTPQGLQYNGQIEASGASLETFLPIVGAQESDVPANIFTKFRTRFNIIMRPDASTISELRLITGAGGASDMQIAGGFTLHHEVMPRIEAGLSVRNIDFDPFIEKWKGTASLDDSPTDMTENPFKLQWLKEVSRKISLRFAVDNYTLLGEKGQASSGQMQLEKDKLVFGNLMLAVGGDTVSGTLGFQHRNDQSVVEASDRPYVSGNLIFSHINLHNAFRETITQPDAGGHMLDSAWGTARINLNALHHMDGAVGLSIGRLEHERFSADNVRLKAVLNNKVLKVADLSAQMWGGQIAGAVTMDATVVPEMDATFKMSNVELAGITKSVAGYSNIGGRTSISTVMRMSGVNFNSWLDSITGQLTLNAQAVILRPFNLQSIIRSALTSRSLSEFKNTLRLAQEQGSTAVDSLQLGGYFAKGSWSVSKSLLQTQNASGEMQGEVDLRRWLVDLKAILRLQGAQEGAAPLLGVAWKGDINSPQLQLDTQSIDAYIANKNH